MDYEKMTVEELEARRLEIATEIDAEDADLDALEEEARAIKAEFERRKAAEAQRVEIRKAVAEGAGDVIEKAPVEKEERKKDTMEIRNSKEYIEAYAEYIKSGSDLECRKLTSTNDSTPNGTASVPVPTIVYDIVKTAWERDGIMSRVRKAYLRGNLKVGFEISGGEATVHAEGGSAVSEEALVLGVVELIPQSIKKWISISDEIYDLRGEDFLRYIYDELTYRIAKKAADTLLAKIVACGTVSTTTCPGVPTVTATQVSVGLVAQAMSYLSDEAADPVVIMNKQTWGAFKAAEAANGFRYDPFEGLPVVFNNSLTAFSAATTGVTFAIVGDLGHGALANFPNGEDITFKFDENSKKKEDLIEVLGREYVALGVVAPDAFVKLVK